mgnify:CR=1 FL=1
MRKFLSKFITFSVVLLLSLIIYKSVIYYIDKNKPEIQINQFVKHEPEYIIAAKNYSFFIPAIDKIISEKKLPYIINKQPLEKTLNLLKDIDYISAAAPSEYLLVGDIHKFYFVVKQAGNYIKKRLSMFINETKNISLKNYTISLIKKQGHIIREISKIKTFPKPKYGGLPPKPQTLHKIYVYVNFNTMIITMDLNHLVNTVNAKPSSYPGINFSKTGLWVRIKKR